MSREGAEYKALPTGEMLSATIFIENSLQINYTEREREVGEDEVTQ